MKQKEILLHQMASSHDEENWFPTMQRALDGLTAEQAAWKDDSTNNSIWQNVNHLTFWNKRFLLKFQGIVPEKFEGDNDATFREGKESGTEDDWKSAKDNLFTVLSDWRTALAAADDEKLRSVSPPSGVWYSVISDLNTHTAYHLGQIIHTRKLQGSWIPVEWGITAPPASTPPSQ